MRDFLKPFAGADSNRANHANRYLLNTGEIGIYPYSYSFIENTVNTVTTASIYQNEGKNRPTNL